jgi:hypothetical protein
MAYFPKSKIKTNLYTNGGEYIYAKSRANYVGSYYETSNGKKYTGKNPQDLPNELLVPVSTFFNPEDVGSIDDNNIINYIFSNVELDINFSYPNSNIVTTSRKLPTYNLTLPTDKDKTLGVFTRYFCKKNNELIYIEISKETFNLLRYQDIKIAWDLYSPLSILWQIKGDKEKTYTANKNNVTILEQRNKWYGFSKYFKEDYLKYYLGL